MCQEIYHMMRTMNQDGLEFQLALQCAPLITGIKISNLLMVCGKREDAVQELLEGSDISCFCVMSSPKKTAFLLYREEELKQYLGRTDVRHLLKKLGYKDSSLDNVLPKFRKRYEAHMNGEQQFPHERSRSNDLWRRRCDLSGDTGCRCDCSVRGTWQGACRSIRY